MPSDDVADLDDLTLRAPGQAVMSECLRRNGDAASRGPLARALGRDPLLPDARRWYADAIGERTTGALLDALGPEYVVLHSVPVADGHPLDTGIDVDHLVVGPAGVLTVTTGHHRDGAVRVDGDRVLAGVRSMPWVDTARRQRRRVEQVLAGMTLPVVPVIPVASIVAVVGARGVVVDRAPGDVQVLDGRRLVRTVRRMPEVLGPDAVWMIAGALASAATWTDGGRDDVTEQCRTVERFGALEQTVRSARCVRSAWGSALALAVAGGLVAAASFLPALLG